MKNFISISRYSDHLLWSPLCIRNAEWFLYLPNNRKLHQTDGVYYNLTRFTKKPMADQCCPKRFIGTMNMRLL